MMKSFGASFTWMAHNVVAPAFGFLWQHPSVLTVTLAVAMAAGVAAVYVAVKRQRQGR